jgi:hypothetical protein
MRIRYTARDFARPVILCVIAALSLWGIFSGPSAYCTVASAIVLAVVLFSGRKHYRVIYGAIEIGFGIFVLIYAWHKGRGGFSSDFNNDFQIYEWQLILLQTFGAIFIIIRGLDNIGQGSEYGKASRPAVVWAHAFFRKLIAIL